MAVERNNCWDWEGPKSEFTIAYAPKIGATYMIHELPSEISLTTLLENPEPYKKAIEVYNDIRAWMTDPLRKGEFYLHIWGNVTNTLAMIDCHVDDPDTAFEFKMRWC